MPPFRIMQGMSLMPVQEILGFIHIYQLITFGARHKKRHCSWSDQIAIHLWQKIGPGTRYVVMVRVCGGELLTARRVGFNETENLISFCIDPPTEVRMGLGRKKGDHAAGVALFPHGPSTGEVLKIVPGKGKEKQPKASVAGDGEMFHQILESRLDGGGRPGYFFGPAAQLVATVCSYQKNIIIITANIGCFEKIGLVDKFGCLIKQQDIFPWNAGAASSGGYDGDMLHDQPPRGSG